MKKRKHMLAVIIVGSMMVLTACEIRQEQAAVTEKKPVEETVTEVPVETKEEPDAVSAQAKTVTPLPSYIDLNQLTDCTLAVSFEKADFIQEGDEYQLHARVYDYELFDMVDIAALQAGDTLVIDGQEMKVETIERDENGAVVINGDIEEGGTCLWTNDDGVYYEIGMDDYKSYYEVGEITLPLSPDFVFTDSSDLENPDKTYDAQGFKEYLEDDANEYSYFVPNNCKLIIADGRIISMDRVFTP